MLPVLAFAHVPTVKTNHHDVNLWSEAGRTNGAITNQIRRFEEIQVLKTQRLANGETWYKVQLRRYPEGSSEESIGWVDAKFFTRIEEPVDDDQPAESIAAAKQNCDPSRAGTPISRRQSEDLAAVSRAAGGNNNSFIWPVGGYMRSGFGYRRHPIKGVVKLHRGMDISGNNGAKVRAAKGGTIEVSAGGCRPGQMKCNGGAGNMITINHGDGTKTRYLHLNQNCRLPRSGTRVSQNDIIGCVGATGGVTGPHLHFEVIKNGKWINPLTVLPKKRN